MKIKYLNGNRLYYAVLAGGNAVIEDQKYLNKINVFPVPDADTGTNLASTMRSIAEQAEAHSSFKATMASIADAALSGAQGNSGLIFAQFIYGISQEIKSEVKASPRIFAEAVRSAVKHTYKSIVKPVEGTMLTVIKDWADALYQKRTHTSDFVELLSHGLQVAKKSLKDTPQKLSVLAKAGVVDAGAKGFVDFLEGIIVFIKNGQIKTFVKQKSQWDDSDFHVHATRQGLENRYCTEALITGENMDLDRLRTVLNPMGSSAIIAGSPEKIRIHIHADRPQEVFDKVLDFGDIIQVKVDDMVKQYEASHNPKYKIALVTDSAGDLPEAFMDEHQIHMVPIHMSYGNSLLLDKVTIKPDQFYNLLKTSKLRAKSGVPSLKSVQNLLNFLASHYESIIFVTLSSGLSAMNSLALQAVRMIPGKTIAVLDSKQISVSQGLIVMRLAEAISEGKSFPEIMSLVGSWVEKTEVLVDIQPLKYMVRSGRVSPAKGLLAKLLNLKPIISLDSEGKAFGIGKTFSRKSNMKKIIRIIEGWSAEKKIWNYAIVHAQNLPGALDYGRKLEAATGQKPAYIDDVSPVIGVHNGIGVVGIGVMFL